MNSQSKLHNILNNFAICSLATALAAPTATAPGGA